MTDPAGRRFDVGLSVSLMPLRIELHDIRFDARSGPGSEAWLCDFHVADRDTGEPLRLHSRLPVYRGLRGSSPADQMEYASALRHALRSWFDHELCELIAVDGVRIFEEETAKFH